MVFQGIDDQTVEFVITNYQFPEDTEGDYDSNWLNVYTKVKSKVGNWQTVDPSILTWELKQLIDWFDLLSNDLKPEFPEMAFIEPNLSFKLVDNSNSVTKTFRIIFDYESRPQSAEDNKEYFVDCVADNNELKRIVKGLIEELAKYPER